MELKKTNKPKLRGGCYYPRFNKNSAGDTRAAVLWTYARKQKKWEGYFPLPMGGGQISAP